MEKRALTKWIRVFTTEQVIDGLDMRLVQMKHITSLLSFMQVPPCIMIICMESLDLFTYLENFVSVNG